MPQCHPHLVPNVTIFTSVNKIEPCFNVYCSLLYASDNLKKDKTIVLTAALQLRNDPEVVTIAVKQDALALEFASIELKNNQEIVETAVNKNGDALKFASREMKDTRAVVMVALASRGSIYSAFYNICL